MQGLTQNEVAVRLRDLASPLAVPRLEVLRRNPKLGNALLTSPKASRLARNVLRLARQNGLEAIDVKNMMAAAEKRRRRMDRRKIAGMTPVEPSESTVAA